MAFKKKEPPVKEGENPTGAQGGDAAAAAKATKDPEEKAPASKKKPEADGRPKKFRIFIDQQDNWDKNQDVFCTDGQGKQFLIQRGQEVVVPEGVVNVLKEAVITRIEKDKDGNDIERHIPRFAMRIIGPA